MVEHMVEPASVVTAPQTTRSIAIVSADCAATNHQRSPPAAPAGAGWCAADRGGKDHRLERAVDERAGHNERAAAEAVREPPGGRVQEELQNADT
jgi:hypothetical protein